MRPFFFFEKKWAKVIPMTSISTPSIFFQDNSVFDPKNPKDGDGDPPLFDDKNITVGCLEVLDNGIFPFYEHTPKKRKEKSVVVFLVFR